MPIEIPIRATERLCQTRTELRSQMGSESHAGLSNGTPEE
ncbi:hypothetical protein CES85_3378 (plasmid) [Ochrobactrum quorumnocens]|uniref:Uncharacterized protein n=1 Tax=Ochrobactrum quorumnocens TaxID=271865 RepID=A0A248UP63_9HYPH|nr:hypothetical protein CES85_3378 [[Ochrobactrum] quorumnocens]